MFTSKTGSGKASLDPRKPDQIKEKVYVSREIETSITLLSSPENEIILQALLYLSKYADIQRNNLVRLQAHGLLPKLLSILDKNICILRVTLRLLALLLELETAQTELNQDQYDDYVLQICHFFVTNQDTSIKHYCSEILAVYSTLGKAETLLVEEDFVKIILRNIKSPDNEVILLSALRLLNKFIECEAVREQLATLDTYNLDVIIGQMTKSVPCFHLILNIFSRMAYFGEERFRDSKVIELILALIIEPNYKDYVQECLTIVTNAMIHEATRSYFVPSLQFLKFCQWAKTCPPEYTLESANILTKLSDIDEIKQMLFDLNVEDTILSFLRSEEKEVLNITCQAISNMSRHQYCCEKMLTPIVMKILLTILSTPGTEDDPNNETALATLHYFCRRDSRTLQMIQIYEGLGILVELTGFGTVKRSQQSFRRLLEIINMFVASAELQVYVLTKQLYEGLIKQIESRFQDIRIIIIEILINCLHNDQFRSYFITKNASQMIVNVLKSASEETELRIVVIFIHSALMYENLLWDLIAKKLLLVLKEIPEAKVNQVPLITTSITLIYNKYLPLKFYEVGRLELIDKLNDRFYMMTGPWEGPYFPFLEALQLRRMSTMYPIYVVSFEDLEIFKDQFWNVDSDLRKLMTVSSSSLISTDIQYGGLSKDPMLVKHIFAVAQLVEGVRKIEDKVKIIANFVDDVLCGPDANCTIQDKKHTFKLHLECIRIKLGTNMIPIGYLRLGFHRERALLFKALADQVGVPASLVNGGNSLYWNEIVLIKKQNRINVLKMYVVDLMNNMGQLLAVGSQEGNLYCNIQ